MPLEIRELIIRVTVNEGNNINGSDDKSLAQKLKEMENRIIRNCIEKLADKIEKRDER